MGRGEHILIETETSSFPLDALALLVDWTRAD